MQQTEIDLLELLKKDHEQVMSRFKRIQKSEKKEVRLFAQLEKDVRIHMEGEERFFYTLLEQHQQARQRVLESYEEHFLAKLIFSTFNSQALDEERWIAKIKVLMEFMEHHMKEEESQLFPLAPNLLKKEELKRISEQYLELRNDQQKTEK
ncbi:MAG TPA: hemerythrin domain-containing protein [Desulfuromonadaceae bacterium]